MSSKKRRKNSSTKKLKKSLLYYADKRPLKVFHLEMEKDTPKCISQSRRARAEKVTRLAQSRLVRRRVWHRRSGSHSRRAVHACEGPHGWIKHGRLDFCERQNAISKIYLNILHPLYFYFTFYFLFFKFLFKKIFQKIFFFSKTSICCWVFSLNVSLVIVPGFMGCKSGDFDGVGVPKIEVLGLRGDAALNNDRAEEICDTSCWPMKDGGGAGMGAAVPLFAWISLRNSYRKIWIQHDSQHKTS